MRERPVLFSAPMVRALLDCRKTQTRRVVSPRHDWHVDEVPDERGVFRPWPVFEAYVYAEPETVEVPCPYGAPGDRLWVKESIRRVAEPVGEERWCESEYIADGSPTEADVWLWKNRALPSIHMPRGLSRIALEVTAVRVERLQDISEEDAKAEGIERSSGGPWRAYDAEGGYCYSAVDSYRSLWESINGPDSWAANPWVWVVEFRRVTS